MRGRPFRIIQPGPLTHKIALDKQIKCTIEKLTMIHDSWTNQRKKKSKTLSSQKHSIRSTDREEEDEDKKAFTNQKVSLINHNIISFLCTKGKSEKEINETPVLRGEAISVAGCCLAK